MRVRQVLVFIAAGPNRATPIPPELISRMQRFALGEEAPPPKSTRKRRSAERIDPPQSESLSSQATWRRTGIS